jgi:16S rRNA (cytosine967-C5)-methyltransferase
MTPGARLAAAAAILDRVLAGEAAERALTNWARASRFAGARTGRRSATTSSTRSAAAAPPPGRAAPRRGAA